MNLFPPTLENLIDKFASLPGIGRKTAQRLAFFVLSQSDEEAEAFADAVVQAKKNIFRCHVCHNLTDSELCPICRDPGRDTHTICVVSDPKDVVALERGREYDGLYHVLHGVISPMNHVSPDDLTIRELVARISEGDIREVIMATNPDTEGETTARYISRPLKPFDVKITRLAYGVPVGANLEFADDATLSRAMEGRTDF